MSIQERRLEIGLDDLKWAASRGLLPEEQVEDLWMQLRLRSRDRPSLSSSHVAYYSGAIIVLLGMSWLLGMAWSNEWGGVMVFLIAAAYIVLFAGAGHHLWFKKRKKIPGGLLMTIAVCIVPIATYGFQLMVGLWYRPPGSGNDYSPFFTDHSLRELVNFLPMELSGLLAALITVRIIPFPFLTAIIGFVLWYMVMDWTSTLAGDHWGTWYQDVQMWVSMAYGTLCIGFAYMLDKYHARHNESTTRQQDYHQLSPSWIDYTYWVYMVGAFAFWSGLELLDIETEWVLLIRCVVNIGLVALSIVLNRRILALFGAIGIVYYLMHLNELFNDWVIFPFIITALGTLIIGLGLYRNNVTNDELNSLLQEAPADNQTGTMALSEQEHVVEPPEGEREHHGNLAGGATLEVNDSPEIV